MFGADGGFFEAAGGEVEALAGANFSGGSQTFQGIAPWIIGWSLGEEFHLEWMLRGGRGFNGDFDGFSKLLSPCPAVEMRWGLRLGVSGLWVGGVSICWLSTCAGVVCPGGGAGGVLCGGDFADPV